MSETNNSNEVVVSIKNLQKAFGDNVVLRDIDLDVHKGEVVVVLGPSGSGKSTMLRCINRLEEPTSGSIVVEGVDVCAKGVDLNKVRTHLGMVFQQFNLFAHMTVLQNVMLGPVDVLGVSKEEARERAMDLLSRVGVAEQADKVPAQLSGGQQQRLCIARTLLKHPRVLIFDDSTSAVDMATDAKIREHIARIPDTTVLIIAQRISSVQDADHIIVMEGGRIAQIGNHDELLKTSEIYRETFTSQNKMSAEGEGAVEANTDTTVTQAQTQEGGEAHE